jgi:hypothetical protein
MDSVVVDTLGVVHQVVTNPAVGTVTGIVTLFSLVAQLVPDQRVKTAVRVLGAVVDFLALNWHLIRRRGRG